MYSSNKEDNSRRKRTSVVDRIQGVIIYFQKLIYCWLQIFRSLFATFSENKDSKKRSECISIINNKLNFRYIAHSHSVYCAGSPLLLIYVFYVQSLYSFYWLYKYSLYSTFANYTVCILYVTHLNLFNDCRFILQHALKVYILRQLLNKLVIYILNKASNYNSEQKAKLQEKSKELLSGLNECTSVS